jgi:hypothetical protein
MTSAFVFDKAQYKYLQRECQHIREKKLRRLRRRDMPSGTSLVRQNQSICKDGLAAAYIVFCGKLGAMVNFND